MTRESVKIVGKMTRPSQFSVLSCFQIEQSYYKKVRRI